MTMFGPFPMSIEIVRQVPESPGAYVVGSMEGRALYVGRSDNNLRGQLELHFLPNPKAATGPVADRFWYGVATSAIHAYQLECQWYHHYFPIYNAAHPVAPYGLHYTCPICGR